MNPFGWYRALMRNPQYRWIVILGSLLYLISPIDLSPDIIPLVGQIDDVIIVTLLFSELFQRLLGGATLESSQSPRADFASQPHRQTYDADSAIKTVDVKAVSVDENPKSKI